MKKALIIGAAGFVGRYLIEHIKKHCSWSITATKMPGENIEQSNLAITDLNLLERTAVTALLKELRPDYIFHLAAQSSVALSWKNPDLTVDVNIKGCLHLLDAARTLDYTPRILLIGSGEEYGEIQPAETPVKETTPLRPGNPYAVTKACQNMIGSLYAKAYGMDILMVRAFNHVGPKQSPQFVLSDFCKQVAKIEQKEAEPAIKVGNLTAKRDFSDVRDVVAAYICLMEQGCSGETYNVGSGKAIGIDEMLNLILTYSTEPIRIETDPKKLRPVDVPIIEADITKLVECTGWRPDITLEQTIKETLEYWRNQ